MQLYRIDDIEDASEYRRGQVCAYKKFGIPLTLNSANLAYFEALKLLQACADHSADLTAIFTEEMINLHVGQGSEIYFRDQGSVASPKIEEYYKICSLKTGGLFRLFTRLLLKCSKKTIDVETEKWIIGLAEDLGKFYQVRDDYLNIFKGDASDLIEGKFTLPTIFAEIKNIKNQKSEDILDTLRAVEADKFCLRTLSEFAEEMENLIFEIEQKTERQNNLKDVINSLL